ncbi:hypothetical protein SAMN04489812_2511 [Microlunatus soli]|uniref:Uncharacterized protein n=1 Tax=Microlunatus soli TaxID=630515 RepID=A0A1H1TUU6_9ACTN|nr:hypothetical protein SAMN04489812_2511 [Microlunatus soli]
MNGSNRQGHFPIQYEVVGVAIAGKPRNTEPGRLRFGSVASGEAIDVFNDAKK